MQPKSVHAKVVLKPGRDAPVRGGNPWIFSGAIAKIEPERIEPGTPVDVHDAAGALLGCGYANPATTIAVRILAWRESLALDSIVARRIENAIRLRASIIRPDTNCYRLVNGDGDGLSGVVIDRYGDVLVLQLLTAGADRMRDAIVRELGVRLAPRAIVERSQGAVRRQEGLEDSVALLAGEAPGESVVLENGNRIVVDFEHGQKTGYFLDQRENRARIAAVAKDARVLDAFCYSGGFTLSALRAGASRVVAVDTSAKALGWAKRNLELNGFDSTRADLVHGDAGEYLANAKEQFDIVVLDPPPLARSRKDAPRAAHLYVELNTLAMRALAAGGRMMTFSCSAHLRGDDFIHAVGAAQAHAARNLRIVERLGPGPDHPVLLGHGEGEYLTGLLLADLG